MKIDINTGIDSHETLDHCKKIFYQMIELQSKSNDIKYKEFLGNLIEKYHNYINKTYGKTN